MDFCNYLREKRKEKGLSQRRLAELSGVSNTEISRLESGSRHNPSPKILKALSPYVGGTYNDLLKAAGYIDEIIENDTVAVNKEDIIDDNLKKIYNELKDANNIEFISLMIRASKELPNEDLQVIRDLTYLLLSKQPKQFRNYISYVKI